MIVAFSFKCLKRVQFLKPSTAELVFVLQLFGLLHIKPILQPNLPRFKTSDYLFFSFSFTVHNAQAEAYFHGSFSANHFNCRDFSVHAILQTLYSSQNHHRQTSETVKIFVRECNDPCFSFLTWHALGILYFARLLYS